MNDLFAALYPELRRLAAAQVRGRTPSLQPTALVHEAWLRLCSNEQPFLDRNHFLATAATVIRRLLVDHHRRRQRLKRGGARRPWTSIEAELADGSQQRLELLDLEDALEELASLDARKARVVELRVFAGATIDETAAILGISHMTVSGDWQLAKAWLIARLQAHGERGR